MAHKRLIALMLITTLLTACQAVIPGAQSIKGSGSIVLQERSVSGFTGVQVYLGADLTLVKGDGEALTIEGDDNLMQYVLSEVQNGRLVISTSNNTSISPSRPLQLTVTYATLTSIDIFGRSKVTAEALDQSALAISFAGSGSSQLSGTVDTQTISISGNATINNFDLSSRNVTVDIKGSGTVEVNVSQALNITVAGTGTIRYAGSPTITRNVIGSATISPRQ